jgi:hypothetical protein
MSLLNGIGLEFGIVRLEKSRVGWLSEGVEPSVKRFVIFGDGLHQKKHADQKYQCLEIHVVQYIVDRFDFRRIDKKQCE